MIRHTVAFRLIHPPGSDKELNFLDSARDLAKIPSVEQFECLKQVGVKSNFKFALSMAFADEAAYAAYNDHSVHKAFVDDRWSQEVVDFLELDYVIM